MPGTFDLSLYRGDTYRWRVRLWSDDAASVPVDLTDVTAKSEIRNQPGGATIAVLTCVVTLPNIIDLTLPVGLWATIPAGAGAWDLQLTFPGPEVKTVLAGRVTTTADVTDSTATTVMAARAQPVRASLRTAI